MQGFRVLAVPPLALGAASAQEHEARPPAPDRKPATDRLKVLYLEDTPRWEYRYVKNGLVRQPDVALQCVLYGASTDFRQEASAGLPALKTMPIPREELFAYDVVLIGDVPPERIDRLTAPAIAWMQLLADFVEAGGGVGFLAGERACPDSYRGTPFEKLLPVELEPKRAPGAEPAAKRGFHPQLVEPEHEITELQGDPEKSAALWRHGFPSLMSYLPVARARDQADVLLVHPTDRNEHGPRVIAAAAKYGKGRTFFIATDETWRWRKPYGEKYQDRFWLNVVRYLGQGKQPKK